MPDAANVDVSRLSYVAITISVLLIGAMLELIRRGKLREEYALVWMGAALVSLFFSVFRSAFDSLATFLGIAYGPSLLILLVVFGGIPLAVHFSIVISRLTAENKRLAQEVALLSARVNDSNSDE